MLQGADTVGSLVKLAGAINPVNLAKQTILQATEFIQDPTTYSAKVKAGLQAGLNTAAAIAGCFEISSLNGMLTVKPQVAAAIGQALSDQWAGMDRSERHEFAGRGLFEVASMVIAPAKLAQLAGGVIIIIGYFLGDKQ